MTKKLMTLFEALDSGKPLLSRNGGTCWIDRTLIEQCIVNETDPGVLGEMALDMWEVKHYGVHPFKTYRIYRTRDGRRVYLSYIQSLKEGRENLQVDYGLMHGSYESDEGWTSSYWNARGKYCVDDSVEHDLDIVEEREGEESVQEIFDKLKKGDAKSS